MKEIVERAEKLSKYISTTFPAFPSAATVNIRLNKALKNYDEDKIVKPLIITLFGGTGVGKSTLFNKLTGIEGASPVSSGERLKTRVPYIALGRNNFAWQVEFDTLTLDPEGDMPHKPEYVKLYNEDIGAIFIDTPDIDGILMKNHEVTRKMAAMSDIIVYVTSGEKYNDADIISKIRYWAGRKRWFFVMNRFDEIDEKEALQRSFAGKVNELGFEEDDKTVFFVDSVNGEFDYHKLRESLFSSRSPEDVKMFRVDQLLLEIEYALRREDVIRPIRDVKEEIGRCREKISESIGQLYRENLEKPEVTKAIDAIVKEKVWQSLGGKVGFFISFVVWLKLRIHAAGAAFQLGRMFMGSISIVRILMLGFHSIMAALRGTISMRRLFDKFDNNIGDKFELWRKESVEILKENYLFLPDKIEKEESLSDATERVSSDGIAAKAVMELIPLLKKNREDGKREHHFFDEVLPPIERAIEESAARVVEKRVGWFHRFFGNLLPTIFFFHMVFRVVHSWILGVWLPFGFYTEALLILIVSLLPGYFLISAAVVKSNKKIDIDGIIDSIPETYPVKPLLRGEEMLEHLIDELILLETTITVRRETIKRELNTGRFGISRY